MILCSVQDAVILLTLFQIPVILNRIATISDKYWRFYFFTCTTCIVYQYFKELAAFVSKAGAKIKTLFLTTKLFRKFFFNLSLYSFLRLSMRKGKNVWKKGSGLFLCESECKDKNFIYYPPKLFGSFFVLFFRTNHAFSTSQFRKAFFSWKAGAKVRPFRIPSKYIKLFFRTFFEGIS